MFSKFRWSRCASFFFPPAIYLQLRDVPFIFRRPGLQFRRNPRNKTSPKSFSHPNSQAGDFNRHERLFSPLLTTGQRPMQPRMVQSAGGRHHQKSEHPRRNPGVPRHPSARPNSLRLHRGRRNTRRISKGVFRPLRVNRPSPALEQAKHLLLARP